jgi:hypothetical protein
MVHFRLNFRLFTQSHTLHKTTRQLGASLATTMLALGLLGFATVLTMRMLSDGSQIAMKSGLLADAQNMRAIIGRDLDCDLTLEKAKQVYVINNLSTLCSSASTPFIQAKPFLLYGRDGAPLTSNLSTSRFSSGRIIASKQDRTDPAPNGGGSPPNSLQQNSSGSAWWVRATCSWADQTLVVRAGKFRDTASPQFARDPIFKDKQLDFNDQRLWLFGPDFPICGHTKQLRLTKVESFVLDSRDSITIPIDPKDKNLEITIQGQYQGSWDVGADTYFSNVSVDLTRETYSGTHMVKIGSDAKKARTVIWNDTPFESTPPRYIGAPSYYLSYPYSGQNADYAEKKMPVPLLTSTLSEDGDIASITYQEYLDNSRPKARDPTNQYFWLSGVTVRHFATP